MTSHVRCVTVCLVTIRYKSFLTAWTVLPINMASAGARRLGPASTTQSKPDFHGARMYPRPRVEHHLLKQDNLQSCNLALPGVPCSAQQAQTRDPPLGTDAMPPRMLDVYGKCSKDSAANLSPFLGYVYPSHDSYSRQFHNCEGLRETPNTSLSQPRPPSSH